MVSILKRAVPALAMGFFTSVTAAKDAAPNHENPESTVSEVLLKTTKSWDGVTYKSYPPGQPELTVLKFKIPANTTLPWHFHPMPNAAYVVSGTLCVESLDGKHKTKIHAGDVLAEMVDTIHHGRTGNAPVELIAFYAGAIVPGNPPRSLPTAEKPSQLPHPHSGALPPLPPNNPQNQSACTD